MFEKFVGSNVETRRQRPRMIAAISVAVHAGFLLGLLVHGFWQVERLGLPKRDITFAVATALPPPEPPPAPSAKKPQPDPKARVVPRTTTQPVNAQVPDEEIEIVTADQGSDFGVDGGSSNSLSPFATISTQHVLPGPRIDTPPPAPELPRPPATVQPTVIEAQRIAGQKFIQPDEATKLAIARDGRQRVQAVVKMCLSAQGDVTSTKVAQSSGYPDYDGLIVAAMQAWKYRPYLVDNQPAPVCTHVTFIYQQN